MRQCVSRGVVVAALLVCLATATPVGATEQVSQPAPAVAQQTTESNETTVQHERPGAVSGEGDRQEVSQWLRERLVGRLQQSTVELSKQEYERGRELLGDEYSQRLEQYVDVAGQTEGSEDDRTAEQVRETRAGQREFAETAQSYNETYAAYQAARASGNETQARESARELESLADRARRLNASLNANYTALQNRTGIDTGRSRESIRTVTRNLSTQQADVREQTFVGTELTVETEETAVAFDDPLTMAGTLRAANGTAVADEQLQVTVFERQYDVRTDDDGEFTVEYRPVSLPVNTSTVVVAAAPTDESPFLGNETAVSVDVRQVTPTVNVTSSPSRVGYNGSIETTVDVRVDDRPVPGLGISSTLGGTVTGETNDSGRVVLGQRVPRNLSAGPQTVRIETAREDRAVGPVSATVSVRITGSEPEPNRTGTVPDAGSSLPWRRIGVGVSLLGIGVLAVLVRRRFQTDEAEPEPDPEPAVSQPEESTTSRDQSAALLARARSALDDGDAERATVTAYAAVREYVHERADLSESLTNQEFLVACREHDIDSEVVSTVADAYEHTTFAATPTAAMAERAVTAAERILGGEDETS